MRYDRISILIQQLDADIKKQGYFWAVSGKGKQTQTSIIRTNCMDCLDRTNVVQSVFAKHFLTNMLRDIHVLNATEKVEDFTDFHHLLMNGIGVHIIHSVG